MGSKTNTSTTSQNSTTSANDLAALQSIYGSVANAASTPYTPYTGELTAGVNGEQSAGINATNAAASAAQPYYSQASQLASSASNPLTAAQIQQYQNPYTQDVVNATQAQFNDQNGQAQQQLKGNAAIQGALGGDRQAVAQSTLAGQQQLAQAPVIAGLYSNAYNSGLSTAEQQYQTNPLAAASALGTLGSNAQTSALQGANAQINAGTLQQQTQQAADTANYNQYLQQQAYPYAQAQFLSTYGLPAATAQGSTTSANGTQTSPGPNTWSQLLGLGTAALTAFSDKRLKENIKKVGETYDGQPIYKFNYRGNPMTQIGLMAQDVEKTSPDAVGERDGFKTVNYDEATKGAADKGHFASGGVANAASSLIGGSDSPYNFIANGVTFIPKGSAPSGSLPSSSVNLQYAKPADNSGLTKAEGSFLGAAGKAYNNSNNVTGGWGATSTDANGVGGIGGLYSSGGLVGAIHEIHRSIKRSRGGMVGTSPFATFADGGDVSFDDRFAPAVDNPFGDLTRGQAIALLSSQQNGPAAPQAPQSPFTLSDSGVINPGDPVRIDSDATQAWRDNTQNPALQADVSPQGGNPMIQPAQPSLPPQITNPDNAPDTAPGSALAFDSTNPMVAPAGQPTSPAPSTTAESRFGSFNPLGLSDKAREAIISGALGVAASRSPFALSAIGEGGLQGMKAYSEATKAEQEAANAKMTQQQAQTRIDQEAKRIANQAAQFAKTSSLAERAQDEKGQMTDYQKAEIERQSKVDDPAYIQKVANAKRTANATLDDDTIHDMADQYLAGDRTVMQNLGRGAQGAENIVKLRQAISKQARDAGVDPKGIVNAFNEQAGALAGQRTVGARAANISLAANEANNMIPIALEASDKLPRSQFMPWNQMVQAVQKGSSSPELASFVAATNSLVNSYVRAVSPSGVPTDSMRQHAYDMLNAAQGPEAYKAVVGTMQKEMQAALSAPGQVKAELRKGNEPTAAATPAATPTPKPATVIQNGHTYTLQPDGSYK